jgi:uncharacterized protein involved in outer membrane biogenesis
MKKKILIGTGIGVLVVILAVVIIAGFFVGDIIKAGMETIGPKVTQTSLTVNSVNVSVLTGSGGVKGLIVGNPAGFKSTNAISVGKAAVSVAPFSVLGDKIVIKSVEVREPEINFDGNPFGANNLQKIMDNVSAFTGGPEDKTADTNAPVKPGAPKPAKKLQVDDFLIVGAKVHFNGVILPLPDIHLANLGQGPDGITPAALIKEVLGQVTSASLKAVVASAGDASKAIGGEASKLGKSLGGLFKK